MFIPPLLGIVGQKLVVVCPEQYDHDPEDLMDDKFLLEVMICCTLCCYFN